MKFRTIISISVFIGGLFVTQTGFAQNQDNQGALLPDISPQDIEIRGEFRARFLGLTRQPILGFDPNLEVYQIDPNRKPFMETGDQVVANLPVSELSRPAPPGYDMLSYAEQINAFARVGAGTFTTPEAQFWGVTSLNQDSYIGGDLDFSSSDGHLNERPSSFRFMTANAEFGTRLNEKTELHAYGGVQNDFNYSADFGTSSHYVRVVHEGFDGGFALRRFKNDIAGWELQGNVRHFSTDFGNEMFDPGIDEWVYNGSFSHRWALGNPGETIAVDLGGRGGNYEPRTLESQQWGTFQGGVTYERLFNYQTHIKAEADVFYTSNLMEDQVYPGGVLKIDHWFGDRLKITGNVEGKPGVQSVEQLHERNRFLGTDNNLIHSYTVDVTGRASLKYYRGSTIHGGVTYSNTKDHIYFLPDEQIVAPNDAPVVDVYSVNYQNATNLKVFAGVTHQLLPERFWVSGQVYLQNPKLNSDQEIPFEENFGARASLSLRPIDRITLQGWADYVGEREASIQNNNTVDDFLLVGSRLDVEILQNFGGYVKVVNILDQEYQVWQGYRERPFQVFGGLTLKF